MRAWSVVRFMPRRSAAPLEPAIRHSVWRSARRICCRSASWRVEIKEEEEVKEAKEVEEESVSDAGVSEAGFSSETGT
jgi:hypothetical protein